ncbi:MAG: cell surface protein SprA [Prevotella sp.]|nr:cell surface protein SprA [Prevotella sp.]
MNKKIKYALLLSLFASGLSLFSGTSGKTGESYSFDETAQAPVEQDSTKLRYPVQKTQAENFGNLAESHPIDLQTPSNIKTEVVYDYKNNVYQFRTRVGDNEWTTPLTLTPEEYYNYTLKKSMSAYFNEKNRESLEKGEEKEEFSLKEVKVDLGPLEKIFGPGGVRLKPQGYAELSMGLRTSTVEDPTISERNKTKTIFDVNEKIQLSVNATVGDKVNFDLNYDTEATFDFDSKKIKLAYEGKEDEIIRYLEGGNVSFNTTNSLVQGATSLFGIRADLQFGKLRINSVVSQQESESQSVNSKGGVQSTPFEFKADAYDENRHFFFGHYFRDHYDEAMSTLPYVKSDISITKIEVWITNKRGNFDQSRNIVAFADLAEHDIIKNPLWLPKGSDKQPYNRNNTLYEEIKNNHADARNISKVNETLSALNLKSGLDYEKIESARLLSTSEYTFNPQLGYISLNFSLQADDVLAVAYEYTKNGVVYQVGELSQDNLSASQSGSSDATQAALFLKLLKPVSLSPASYSWDLMMKNIYALGAYNLQQDKFRLNISYQSDTTGAYINYLPDGNIKNQLLLKVMNLDRLDSRRNKNADGIFDYIEGYTVRSSDGRIIFPVVEPFGEHLRKMIGNDAIADKYVYQELYDSTLTVARQTAEKNKYRISGTYKAASNNEIDLNAMNVARGSVKVMAGGRVLTEGSDYVVDYTTGKVTVINQSIIDAGTPVSVSSENQAFFSMQRKTLLGLNLNYDFSKDFSVGATFMHMYEKPLTVKTEIGNESVKNTLLGFNTSYRTQSQWLTNLLDKLPFVEATVPSQIAFNGEFAQMIPGHYTNEYTGGYSYLDDFESSRMPMSIREPYGWSLSSTPADESMFPESAYSNNIDYGKNRALLAWYSIDDLFTRKNSSLTPSHIKADKEQLSNHFVRRITMDELYPYRDASYNESSYIPALNLSFYPQQRGPYNLDADRIDSKGNLLEPQKRWGGISRKMSVKDFEANNYEYIEFWLMDPFIYNERGSEFDAYKTSGGDLYFNLGEISEDVLKDGRKFFENGLPPDGDPSLVDTTAWGKVPKRQSTVYAFDTDRGVEARRRQDVGLNGLSTAEEYEFQTYKQYLEDFRRKLTDPDALAFMETDPFSPLNDPSGDKYHHFRGSDYDREQTSILNRYKHYNGTNGNSMEGSESYSTASRSVPDVEDIDQDYTLNETESFFQYKVPLYPNNMDVGLNPYINDVRVVKVSLPNGKEEEVKWFQFKIPVRQYEKKIGNIQDFKSIRFIRMYMTNFKENTHLRFGTLDLVRGDWRTYTQNLNRNNLPDRGTINVFSVNIEENGDKEPVNYVLPPGVTRIVDPDQAQLRQENEQALAFRVTDLDPGAARAVYKNTVYDMRRYKRLQLFTHAEAFMGRETELNKNDLSVFIRLGSDYKNNYYEYEIPLTITPEGRYSYNNTSDRELVWPKDNMFDFPLELLKNVKVSRNREKRKAGSNLSYADVYYEYDPDKPNNRVSVVGNPSLSEINVIMIGVRNNARLQKSAEVWINELRLTDFDEEGGWAAQGNLNVALSDLGSVNISGRKETAGFGSIEQSLMERRNDDFLTYSIAANIDAGRFLPEKIKASIPVYYTYSNETTTPKYDPLDQDVTLDEAMSTVKSQAEKDSIRNLAQDKTISKGLSISGMKFNIRSETPMPYDPANFTFGYSQRSTETSNPTTVYDLTEDYELRLGYTYSPMTKTWSPFAKSKSKAPLSKFTKAIGINYLPNNITFNSVITRQYSETSIRDLESYTLGESNNSDYNFLSWSQDFYWQRDFSLTWDFTKNIRASLQTGTKAEIEEPHSSAVNKRLFPDYYERWKDSVQHSLRNLGTPLSYRQTANVSYTLPFATIPFLDWMNSSVKYDSNYSWDRGAQIDEDYKVGNTIANSLAITLNNRLNLLNLYNKSAFLKKVNQKFAASSSSSSQSRGRATTEAAKTPKRFTKDISLSADSAITVVHKLNTKNIKVTAKRSNGKAYTLKYSKKDNNTIVIDTRDTLKLKLSIVPGPDPENTFWYKAAQYTARGLMSVRSISINYSRKKENSIYDFRPNVGDAFGQNSSDYGMAPGIGFAFGFDGGESYVDKAIEKGWLSGPPSGSDSIRMNINPAIFNAEERLEIIAEIEPFKGLKIDLKARREEAGRTEFRHMDTGMPKTFGGSFTMSIVSIASAFESSNARSGYSSQTFDKFIANRDVIAERYRQKYTGVAIPRRGFLSNYAEATYTPGPDDIERNSADVLIPAFLAAYTGKDAGSIGLTPFPSLTSMLPGWNIRYDGLSNIPWIKSKFKSIKLSHTYESLYQIGSYSSFASWVDAGGGLGFKQSVTSDDVTPIPSSGLEISSVSIVESFRPLFGAEATLNNSMTIGARWNKSRRLNLNISSYQIVETLDNEFVVTLGYRINEFNRVIGLSSKNAKGFSNDLNIRADFSHKSASSLIRKIEELYTQATSGSTVTTIKVSADYALSRSLMLRGYYDRVVNTPIVSASSYPTTNTSFGVSLRFTLMQ